MVSVNGRTTRGLIHEDVMAMLRGNSGKIDLTIRRDNKQTQMQVSKEAWINRLLSLTALSRASNSWDISEFASLHRIQENWCARQWTR